MPDNLPSGLFIGVVVLQVIVAVALFVLAARILRAIHAQGLTVLPRSLTAKFKKWFGRAGT